MAYYRPVPGLTDGIPERDQRPRDNGYKSVFTNSWLVRQRHRSWIKGLGKNPQKEWTRSLFSVPFVRGHPSVTSGTPRNDGVYTRQPPWWHDGTPRMAWRGVAWHVYKSTGKNTQKLECVFRRSPLGMKIICVFTRHPTRSGFKWRTCCFTLPPTPQFMDSPYIEYSQTENQMFPNE